MRQKKFSYILSMYEKYMYFYLFKVYAIILKINSGNVNDATIRKY